MKRSFNLRKLITKAIQLEKDGKAFYSKLMIENEDRAVKDFFSFFANEEAEHLKVFLDIEEKYQVGSTEMPLSGISPENLEYISSLCESKIFPGNRSSKKLSNGLMNEQQAIQLAISYEKDSIVFFHEFYDLLSVNFVEREIIGEIIRQEKIHVVKLMQHLSLKYAGAEG